MVRLVALGDSILEGWDGHEDVPRDRTIPKTIGKINGWDVDNKAIGGTQFGSGNNSFIQIASQTNFFAYDVVLVGYGVNDWCYPSGSLSVERASIEQGLRAIRNTNGDIPVLFELPTEDFRNGATSLDTKNNKGWSQNDLCNLIIEVANENGCSYFDWRTNPLITPDNHATTLGDAQVHPTQEIMDKMASALAPVLKTAYDNRETGHHDNPNPDTQPDDPITGVIQLQRLDSPWKIGDNLNSNIKKSVDAMNMIYQKVAGLYGLEENSESIQAGFDNTPDRKLRDGVLMTFIRVESSLNKLISFCNSYGIMDLLNGKTDSVNLDPPRQLTLGKDDNGDYQTQYNEQWKTIEKVLNKLYEYAKEMEGE